ncbi:MAG: HAD-IA family hydrolase [bacterium]
MDEIKVSKVKAIIFDMVGVLIFDNKDYVPDSDIEQVEHAFNHVDDDLLIRDLKSKYMYSDEKIIEIMKKIPDKYSKFDELFDVLPSLKLKYKLAVINNGTAMTIPYFKKKFEFDKYLDLFVNSTEEGVRKPDPQIYIRTCEKLGVQPSECIYIDDRTKNVDAALSVGMHAIYWDIKVDKLEHLMKFNELVS